VTPTGGVNDPADATAGVPSKQTATTDAPSQGRPSAAAIPGASAGCIIVDVLSHSRIPTIPLVFVRTYANHAPPHVLQ
jgi:hypothetical protein